MSPLPPSASPAPDPSQTEHTPAGDAAVRGEAAAVRAGRLPLLLWAVAAGVFAVDQVSKSLVVARLTEGGSVEVLDGLLRLTLLRNPGAAFSLATGLTWVLTVIAVTVVVVVLRASRRLGSRGWALCLGLLLGGALGNLTDRMLRAPGFGRGHVVDFLQVPHWPVFNVSDSAIVCAAVGIVLLGFRGVGLDGRRTGTQAVLPPNAEPAEPSHGG